LGVVQNLANNLLTQISLSADPTFFDVIFANGSYNLSQEILNATCSAYSGAIADLNTAIANLGTLLNTASSGAAGAPSPYVAYNVVIQVNPLTITAGPGTNAQFQVQVTNVGPVADTFFIYAATDLSTNALLPSLFGWVTTQPVIAPGQTFTGTILVPVPPGTTPGAIPLLIAGAGQNYGGQGQAPATLNVVANGLTIAPASAGNTFVNANSTAQIIVTNTGSVTDTFTLSLSGPGALISALATSSVTLAAGASQTVNITIG